MTPDSWARTPAVRRVMQGNRGRDTKPELAVRRLLHAAGLRYRVGVPPVAGLRRSADVVFTRARVAVFVDGCFWHGCPTHFTLPGHNAEYWRGKVTRNAARDRETDTLLQAQGWVVIRIWEHEDMTDAVREVIATVRERRAGTGR